jgi:hypothetical protein
MNDESPAEPRPPHLRPNPSAAVGLFALLLAVPILYVLSMGPVVAISEKTGRGGEAVKTFYAPIIWLHNHTILAKPLEWYAALWGWN